MARTRVFGAVALVAILGVGCGSSGDDEPSTDPTSGGDTSAEAWADGVCSAVTTWQGVVMEAGSTLGEPRDLSVNAVKDAVESTVDATETLVTDVGELGPPDTEAGEEAQQQLKALSDGLQSEADVLRTAIDADATTAEELSTNVSAISGALSNMRADVETALNGIQTLDGAGELKEAFTSAESCQEVGSAG